MARRLISPSPAIQAGLNALQAGDVMTVGAGDYFERPSRTDIAGTVSNPVWIAAEVPGTVRVLDVVQTALNGTLTLDSRERRQPIAIRPPSSESYMAVHNGDFLPKYSSTANLDAASVNSVTKPDQGIAFSGGRLHIRLNGGTDPNGQAITIPSTTGRNVMDLGSSDNIICGWLRFRRRWPSSPAWRSIWVPPTRTVRNCQSDTSRFLCRLGSDAIVEWNGLPPCRLRSLDARVHHPERRRQGGVLRPDQGRSRHRVATPSMRAVSASAAGGFESGSVHEDSRVRLQPLFRRVRWPALRRVAQLDLRITNIYIELGDDGLQFEDDRKQQPRRWQPVPTSRSSSTRMAR